jgi:lysophospholipase L1-like esterase
MVGTISVKRKMTPSTRMPYPVFFSYLGYVIFSLFLAAAILEIGSAVVRSAHHWVHSGKAESLASASPAYQGYPWAQEFWKEENLRWGAHKGFDYIPFLVWGERPWHSKYINVDESVMGNLRRTENPAKPACSETERRVIWMFGGSTLFGLGVPDMATIPSYLSQDLNSTSTTCFLISNFGVEGYLTNQELIQLVELLKRGQRPDLAIFYDGVNDSDAAVSPGTPNAHLEFGLIKSRVEGSIASKLDFLRKSSTIQMAGALAARLRHDDSGALPPSEVSARASAAVDNYEANIRAARMLGQAYNFKVYSFWQPSLAFGRKPLVPFEQQLWDIGPDSSAATPFRILRAVNEEAASRSPQNSGFVFLGHLFDSVKEPIYVDDHMHLGPRGNQIVADAMAKWIESRPDN